jgi:hypothetical protein
MSHTPNDTARRVALDTHSVNIDTLNEPYSLMYVGHAHVYKMAILIISF